MGDPRKPKKKYETPSHPWQGPRIKAEKTLMKDYGLRNKKELWKMNTIIKNIKMQAKSLISREDEGHAKKQKELLLNRLARLGVIKTIDIKLEDILGLDVKAILERRLQTIFLRKGLAKTADQARQFILHGHVRIGGTKVDVPSYIVPVEEESSIAFSPLSTLDNPEHPERAVQKKEKPKPKTELEKEFDEVKESQKVEERIEEAKKEIEEEKKVEEVEKKAVGEAQ